MFVSLPLVFLLIFRLSVSKTTIQRNFKAANYFDTNDLHGNENENSPPPSIDDSQSNPSQEIDNRLKSLQIQSRS